MDARETGTTFREDGRVLGIVDQFPVHLCFSLSTHCVLLLRWSRRSM